MISLRLRPLAVAFVVLAGGRLALAQAVPAAGEAPDKLEPFVVTGSYIPTTETAVEAGPSPVVRIDRKQIAETGLTNTAELLQSITVSNANAVPISNNSTGFTPAASSISLRGLGPEATLVLINGRRVAAYPVGAGGSTAFVDLNSIPLSAIESIEVLKDGASSIYGADAVAGVINVKLRRGLDGSEVFSSYGNTTHQDSSEVVASVATGAVNDKVTLLAGANYYQRQSILHRDRAYSAIAPRLSANSSPMNFELTRFSVANALGQPLQAAIPGVGPAAIFFFAQSGADAANNGTKPASAYTFSPDRSSTYNPNDAAMTYPEIERLGGFASAERKLFGTDNVKGYVDLSYQNVRTEYHLAPTPTGDFTALGQTELIIPARTANPILTLVNPFLGFVVQVPAGFAVPPGSFPGPGTQFVNGTAQRLAAPGAFNPNNPFNQDIADGSRGRLTEFGNRIIRNRTDAFMTTVGVKGDNLAGRWNFDGSFSYSSIRDETRNSLVSASRFNDIVNANSPIFNRGSSSFIGTTTPYNPFGYYRNRIAANDATTNYARVTVKDTNESTLAQVSAVLSTADLLKFPHGSVGFAVGVDFRREELDQEPDAFGSSGDLIGQAPRATTTAQRKIGGMFAEAKVPMLPRLEATLSLRHERFYTSDDDVTVPKAGLRWQPIARQLTVRGSYSEGFREPSLFERYSTPISVLSSILDPRDGFVEPEQRVTLRGNRKLEAEKTDYANLGFIWSPTTPRLKGLTLGADYWRIHRDGTVEANPQNTVFRAFGAVPGGLQDGEAVFLSASGAISVVDAVFFNVGRTRVAGWDFSGAYQLPTDRLGRWELSTVWTLMTTFERAALPDAPLRDVLGLDSTGSGENGYLKLKGRVSLNWSYKGFSVYTQGFYTDGFADADANGVARQVNDRFLINTQVGYSFRGDHGRFLRDTRVNVGVRNLFDWDPPRSLGGGTNASGYPGYLYTAENQFWYVSVSRKL
jgi:iron complex outermembrane receptor protein